VLSIILKKGASTLAKDYEGTHLRIINSAKKEFLEKGFINANLREISKNAGITTGAFYRHFQDKEALFDALVEPLIQALDTMYKKTMQETYELLDTDQLKEMWGIYAEVLVQYTEFMYQYFDEFKLLLTRSEGTKHQSFRNDLVAMEAKETKRFMEELKRRGVAVNDVSDEELNMVSSAYYASIFEVIIHDYPKDRAIKHAHTLVRFLQPGWKEIFGI